MIPALVLTVLSWANEPPVLDAHEGAVTCVA